MAVLEPIKVVITNFTHSSVCTLYIAWMFSKCFLRLTFSLCLPSQALEVEVPNIPGDPSRGSHRVPLDRVLYIEQSDFRQARNVIIIVIDSLTVRGRAEYINLRFFSVSRAGIPSSFTRPTSGSEACQRCHLCGRCYQGELAKIV